MPTLHILLILKDSNLSSILENAAFRPAGYQVSQAKDNHTAEEILKTGIPDAIIISDQLDDGSNFAAGIIERYPHVPVILLATTQTETIALDAMRMGCVDCLFPPVRTNDVLHSVERALHQKSLLKQQLQSESRDDTKSLRKRIDSLETLQRVGRMIISSLNLEGVLETVVDAAVDLTGAEEGSLLLLDDSSGELYMRAARNFQDDFVKTFRLPIRDTLAGQVLRTGKPLTLDEDTPQKIQTAYFVHTLIYVPLLVHGRVIGVLGVDNRQSSHPFSDDHLTIVSTLADYAAIAIENARLYSQSEVEREKLETILTDVEDGIMVVGIDDRIIFVNQTIREAFRLEDRFFGKIVEEVFNHADLLEIFNDNKSHPSRSEINLEDGRIFNAQVTSIPDVGLVVTMQDITHLKELDRIKSDFVSTVSHDLRSPLTAILGYVELIDRVGPVNDQQKEFIRRVQFSVNNITSLINDLLDLGRIEAGFDARKETVDFLAIINLSVEGYRPQALEKEQEFLVNLPDQMPTVFGNLVRLHQMVNNLVGNAIKYTPQSGRVQINTQIEGEQIILQVSDNGPGIPSADQPYIFEKFFRSSNVPYDTPGTGLGLAIVKSIVENHQGRIWVDSSLGEGSTFIVVLPVTDQEL
jgi:two-component system NtrC family sensor kinase